MIIKVYKKDLRKDIFHSGGPGGQNVETGLSLEGEEWRLIPEDSMSGYAVSSFGRFASNKSGSWRILKPQSSGNGYLHVTVCSKGTTKLRTTLLHRLVMLCFVGPRPEGMVICHNDGNQLNNSVSNLRYDTHKSNAGDKVHHGTNQGPVRQVNGMAKLTDRSAVQFLNEVAERCPRINGSRKGERKRLFTQICEKYGISERHGRDVEAGLYKWTDLIGGPGIAN